MLHNEGGLMTQQLRSDQALAAQLEAELTGNILPVWMQYAPDRDRGGFYGALTNDWQIQDDVPRGSILCARILWTFAAAYRRFGTPVYRDMADHAYAALTGPLWDDQHGGVYWSVDRDGAPVMDRKHHYAQAFAIYGLSEYHRATGHAESLSRAQALFDLLETHAFDPVHGGYIEGSRRDWGPLEDMRLSDREINCRKSMNTLLHMLEAYTNLLRVWDDDRLRRQHRALIEVFYTKVFDPAAGHLRLFFDDDWRSLQVADSYGHDIEASWLLWEAAELHDDTDLHAQIKRVAVQLAGAVYADGRDTDGSIFYEGGPDGITEDDKSWWVPAEGMVGFTNAYQLSGDDRFMAAARACWDYIQAKHIDRANGGWFKVLDRAGNLLSPYKVDPWACPYHHGRACLEMMDRLGTE
jgi:mannobiose 2-epimerase